MPRLALLCLILGAGLISWPAGAQPAPAALDMAALPAMVQGGRAAYERFLIGSLPRAFAIASNGAYGGGWQGGSTEAMRKLSLDDCTERGGHDCTVYVENLDVVWPGRGAPPHTPVPGPVLTGPGHVFVPDERFYWHGPQAARGVYVWAHGLGQVDARGLQPPPHVRAFNNAGYDILRFDRELSWDSPERAADWLRAGLAQLRRMGWKSVISGGHSLGGWINLQMLDTPGLADVVIAESPASYWNDPGAQILYGETELYRMFRAAASPRTRVALIQFKGDPFAGDEGRRIALADQYLKPRVDALLEIDRPEGFNGHFAGDEPKFSERYAGCLLHFATDPTPRTAC